MRSVIVWGDTKIYKIRNSNLELGIKNMAQIIINGPRPPFLAVHETGSLLTLSVTGLGVCFLKQPTLVESLQMHELIRRLKQWAGGCLWSTGNSILTYLGFWIFKFGPMVQKLLCRSCLICCRSIWNSFIFILQFSQQSIVILTVFQLNLGFIH